LRDLCPDLLLVFAYGQLLKQELLSLPRLACVNVHASLLPMYRGASPINATILAGDRESGISIMQMERGLDSGPVYAQYPLTIDPRETADQLETRLGDLAAEQIEPTLAAIASGELTAVPQDHSRATHARKISKADGRIDWSASATYIERQVRAYHPWPGAWFMLPTRKGPRRMTITEAAVISETAAPGTVVHADKHRWSIACGDDILAIHKVIPEGKREMPSVDFLRGSPLEPEMNIST
jgi:methionyl-tRNA formyltransferase